MVSSPCLVCRNQPVNPDINDAWDVWIVYIRGFIIAHYASRIILAMTHGTFMTLGTFEQYILA